MLENRRTMGTCLPWGNTSVSEILHIRLPCSGCEAHLRVSAEHAGGYVKCPSCSVVGPIPSLEECQSWASSQSIAPGPAQPEEGDATDGAEVQAMT